MKTWDEVKEELAFSEEDKALIKMEEDLIRTLVSIREDKGLSQAELADMCKMKQPMLARMERSVNSPRIDSLLRILLPLGYTLKIVPISNGKS